MKCIECGVDNTLKDRTSNQGHCKSCGHRFAFEPTTMRPPLKFTDGFFAKMIDDLSFGGTLFFTRQQLYNLFVRRLERKANSGQGVLQGCGCFLLIIGTPGLFAGFGFVAVPVGALLLALSWWLKRRQRQQQPKTFNLSQAKFDQFFQSWQRANGVPEKLLPPVSTTASAAPAAISPDISEYSFDRVVVCEHDRIAQLLIANNLHFEHSCAVVSLRGYPADIFDTVMEMLRRNPDLSVYTLHDASAAGVRMTETLRLDRWFPNPEVAIYDLGLLPQQVLAMQNPFVKRSETYAQQAQRLPDLVQQHLSPEELEWLRQGNYLPLEMFGPQKLLQVISQGINRSRLQAEGIDSEMASSWNSDGTDSTMIFLAGGFG